MKRLPFFDNPVLRGQLPMWRARLVLILIFVGFAALAGRALFLQGISTNFLQQQGERRYERTLVLTATRGKVLDRNGVVLASSVPARAIWAIPDDTKLANAGQIQALAGLLDIPEVDLRHRLNDDHNFVYLKHQVPMDVADKIKDLKIPGVHQQPEFMRYYPEGDVTAHIVGFDNIEDQGQEGVELAFNKQLSGKDGSRRVIKDRLGRVIEDVQAVNPPVNGRDLTLSIDTRIQYLVYKALQDAMIQHKARAASGVVLDAKTGEILAMSSLPTFDPNHRDTLPIDALRNRTVTDTFEPGSIMKPFTAALALDLGRITTNTMFATGNGRFQYQGNTITDVERGGNGTIDVGDVLKFSSNIGMTLISEKLEPHEMWDCFTALGLGQAPQIGFPGVAPGRLRPWQRWRLIEKATMAYGYGLSLSLLQAAHAYTVFARDGDMVSLSLVKRDSAPTSVRVYSSRTAALIRSMLEAAAADGSKISVPGYRVAGKSGTARMIVNGRYSLQSYRSSFVGFAPVSNPRIIVAISVEDPKVGGYYGAVVSGPVFARIVGGTLRMLGVQPDAPLDATVAMTNSEAVR